MREREREKERERETVCSHAPYHTVPNYALLRAVGDACSRRNIWRVKPCTVRCPVNRTLCVGALFGMSDSGVPLVFFYFAAHGE